MRLFRPVVSYALTLAVLGATLVGCSGHATTASLTPATSTASSNQTRPTTSLGAIPIGLSAFPISLSAFPISLSAYPAAQGAILLNASASQPCATNASSATCTVVKYSPSQKITANTPASNLAGYLPIHLQGAYNLGNAPQQQGAGMTIAIVTTGTNSSTLDSDLSVYRKTFGLPPCTIASGCLKVVNAAPAASAMSAAWSEESAIDTEMVSAICPLCSIVVVLASSGSIADLSVGVTVAASYHPVAISNSYAVPEASDNVAYAPAYSQPGIAIVAGAGDTGFGVNFPASAPTVIAVGGTSLSQTSDGHFQTQVLWPHTGSGCSAFFAQPAWQSSFGYSGCTMRMTNDIAATADPAFGIAGYSSAGGGWNVYGGTSVAAPIVAAMYGLVKPGPHYVSDLYQNGGYGQVAWLGSNGTCAAAFLCSVVQGDKYNAPVGLGVPNGLGPFQPRSNATAPTSGLPSLTIDEYSNGPWQYGQNGSQLSILLDNVGAGPTSGTVTVTGTLPQGASLNGSNFGQGVSCSALGFSRFSCSVANVIAAESNFTFNVPITLPSNGMGRTITTTASAYGGGDPVHSNSGSAVTSSASTPMALPSLAISGSSNTSNGPWTIGQTNSQYAITVANTGVGPTSNGYTVTIALPAGLSFTTSNGNNVNVGGGYSCSLNSGDNFLSCQSNNHIGAGQSASLNVPVTIGSGAGSSATATVSVYGGGDPVYTSLTTANIGSITAPVANPNLAVTETSNGPWTSLQGGTQYAITVANNGPTATFGTITVTAQLPNGVASNGIGGGNNGGFGCNSGTTATCTSKNVIAAGASATFTIPVTVAGPIGISQSANGPWQLGQNNAQLRVSLSTVQPYSATETSTVAAFGGGDQVHVGARSATTGSTATAMSFTSPALGGSLTFTEQLPYGFTWDGNSPGGFYCNGGGDHVTCSENNVFNGTANLQFQGAVASTGVGSSLTSTASVQYNGLPAGANTLTTPISLPSLAVSMSANNTFVSGHNAQYQILVSNTGAGATGGTITISDALPSGFTWDGNSPGGFSCGGGNQLTCTATSTINAGQTQKLNVNGTLAVGMPLSVSNTVAVYGGGDPNHNSSATAATATTVTNVAPH